jgi:tRNA dimethylallyltransferase
MTVAAPRHLVIIGPTASGKSALALALAQQRPGVELISADAMQVYRGMDIGTAKPTAAEQALVRHHGIDVADPSEDYAVARFQRDVRAAVADITARGSTAVLVGGTGLYVRAIVDDLDIPPQFADVRAALEDEPDTAALFARLNELDPLAASRMEPMNRRRVVRALEVCLGSGRPFSAFGPGLATYDRQPFVQVGVSLPRPVIDDRIAARYAAQMEAGFLNEVRALLARPDALSRTAGQALGYRELIDHLEGRLSMAEAVEIATSRTRRFARRQERWFRRDPRLLWLEATGNPMDLLPELLAAFDEIHTGADRLEIPSTRSTGA